jgi:holliday junction DNA helicase RuvA
VERRNFLWKGKEKCIFIRRGCELAQEAWRKKKRGARNSRAAPAGQPRAAVLRRLSLRLCRTIARMIAHLRGTLLAKRPNQAIVETHGVGYDVAISVPTFTEMPAAGAEVALHIHTHVREDALSLYGFLRLAEKQLFEKLLTVSGIGPKLAITILSGMPADEMVGAIRGGDLARLTRIPGIGKKTAERMVLELRDKLPAAVGASEMSAALASPVEEDVVSALVNLGYQRAAADKALLAARGGKSAQSFDVLFREALGSLSK